MISRLTCSGAVGEDTLLRAVWNGLECNQDECQEIKMASSKKKGPVEKIALQCTECKQKNYTTEKNRRNTPGKLELMKYCPFEHKHTLHRETKIK